jgi:protease stability complex PrcB-like protein
MLLIALLVVAIAQTAAPPVTTVAQGANSGISEASEVVVRSRVEWDALWKAHAGLQPIPAVDFSQELIAAVFLGTRRSGGFGAEIVGTRLETAALVIEYRERMPAAGDIVTQALTSPFHIVRAPRFDGPVRFRKIK